MTYDQWVDRARLIGSYMLDGSARCSIEFDIADEREDCPDGFLEVDFARAEYFKFTIRASRKRLNKSPTLDLDTIHEFVHVLLYPYTRLASACATATADTLDSELSAREEEVVERIAQVMAPAVLHWLEVTQ